MKWKIWIPAHGDTEEGAETFDDDRPWNKRYDLSACAEYAAEKYADECWCDWGHDYDWPIDFMLRAETGELFEVDVHVELEPDFSTGGAVRRFEPGDLDLSIARHYAPREARG